MPKVHLSLGSNLGDRQAFLERAREAILRDFTEVRFSRIYETEPVDLRNQPWFLNQVAEFHSDGAPEILLEWAGRLEVSQGRKRDVPKGPRTLDVDILLFGVEVRSSPDLVLPHPGITSRRHVLTPLAELVPDLILPGTSVTVRDALEKVRDKSRVKIWPLQS